MQYVLGGPFGDPDCDSEDDPIELLYDDVDAVELKRLGITDIKGLLEDVGLGMFRRWKARRRGTVRWAYAADHTTARRLAA